MRNNTETIPAQACEPPADEPAEDDDGFTFVGRWMAPLDDELGDEMFRPRGHARSPVPRPGLLGSLGGAVVALGCVAAVVWQVSGPRSVTALDGQPVTRSLDVPADVQVDVVVDATGAEPHCAVDVSVQVDTRAGAAAEVRTRVRSAGTTVDARARSRSRARPGKETRRRLEMDIREDGAGQHSVDVDVREYIRSDMDMP